MCITYSLADRGAANEVYCFVKYSIWRVLFLFFNPICKEGFYFSYTLMVVATSEFPCGTDWCIALKSAMTFDV